MSIKKYKVTDTSPDVNIEPNSILVEPIILLNPGDDLFLTDFTGYVEKPIEIKGENDFIEPLQHTHIKTIHDENGAPNIVYYVNRTYEQTSNSEGVVVINLNQPGETFPSSNNELYLVSRITTLERGPDELFYGSNISPECYIEDVWTLGFGLNNNNTQLVINNLDDNLEYRIIVTIKKEHKGVKEKTKIRKIKTVYFNTFTAVNAKEIKLGKADVISIISIKQSNGVVFDSDYPTAFLKYEALNEIEITNNYKLSQNITNLYYNTSSILPIGNFIPTSPIKVTFEYYEHTSGDFLSVDSYDLPLEYMPAQDNKSIGDFLDFRLKAASLNININEDEDATETDAFFAETKNTSEITGWKWGALCGGEMTVCNTNLVQIDSNDFHTPIEFRKPWINISLGLINLGIRDDNSMWYWGGEGISFFDKNSLCINVPDQVKHYTINSDGTINNNCTDVIIDCTQINSLDFDTIIKEADYSWKQVSVSILNLTNLVWALAIKTDGSLWGVGNNDYGQLGDGTTNSHVLCFENSNAGSDWKVVEAGLYSVAGIKTNGTLWTWGDALDGILGLGDEIDKIVPTQVGSDSWKQVDVGYNFMIGIKSDGTLWGWGKDVWGVYGFGYKTNDLYSGSGTGATGYQYTPTRIDDRCDWAMISVGNNFVAGIRTDGTLWVWGFNSGVRGGSTIFECEGWYFGNNFAIVDPYDLHMIMTQIPGSWKYVSSGENYILAIQTDESLWGWGDNNYCQLGVPDLENPQCVGA